MVRWEVRKEIRKRHRQEEVLIRELSRHSSMDRNTVLRCLRQEQWRPYTSASGTDTLLAPHEEYLRSRASQVGYSARIFYRKLVSQKGYRGSYDTVKSFVRTLREAHQTLSSKPTLL